MVDKRRRAGSVGLETSAVIRRSLSFRKRGAEMKDEGGTSKVERISDKQLHAASTVDGGDFVFPLSIMKEHKETRNGHDERSDGETPARIHSDRVVFN